MIAEGIESPVNYIAVPLEAVGDAIRKAGWGEWSAQMMMDYSKAYSNGWGDFINNDIETITGKKPRSFQNFFNEVMSYGLKQRA